MDISEKKYLRGEIHDIGELEAEGSEQRGNRPVLIVSCNEFNEFSPEVVILFITSQLDKRGNKYHINLPGVLGLEKKSMVLAEQIRTVDKSRIIKKRGQLDLARSRPQNYPRPQSFEGRQRSKRSLKERKYEGF